MSYSADEVRRVVEAMLSAGQVVAVAFVKDGAAGVMTFGDPSPAILDALEHTVVMYRHALHEP